MGMHIENIKPGIFVTVTRMKNVQRGTTANYNGIPWKVLSVSFPFVLGEYKGKAFPFDIRTVELTEVTNEYVSRFHSVEVIGADIYDTFCEETNDSESDAGRCPRCNGEIMEFTRFVACENCEWVRLNRE